MTPYAVLPLPVFDSYAGGAGDTDGAAGVQRVLTELREDTAHVMALAGATSVAEVTAELVSTEPGRPRGRSA
ncbi:MAG: alpha-hydroxy-acid oxidizing protein [Hyalangium sp.]|uniref:alpha-hydroxy-acid oxidizing protein n=1 Tax=Hyalangium sp. TaxID=2028555 RepID=UPI0038998B39